MINFFKKLFSRSSEPPRKQGRQRRSYSGAAVSRVVADWFFGAGSADAALRYSIRTMKERCRDLQRNNDHAKRYIGMLVSNVVGPGGVKMQSNVKYKNSRLNERVNNIIEAGWKDFCKNVNFSANGKMSFWAASCLFMRTWAVEGEVLIQRVISPRFKYALAYKFLDLDLLDENFNDVLANGNEVRMGVEVDAFERPVAYHLFNANPRDFQFRDTVRRIRVPAEEIIHCFIPERPGQTRGAPPMSAAITRLKILSGYEEAELISARVSAAQGGFFQSPAGDQFTGDDEDTDGSLIMDVEPGVFRQLPKGVEFVAFDPKHSQTGYGDFVKAILRSVSSGLGIGYNSLANDLEGVNYSSIRHGSLEERDLYAMLQNFLIESFCQPVFESWLKFSLDFGKFDATGRFDDLCKVSWNPRGWKWIDPLKEINAHVKALESGLTSKQDILADQGKDYREVLEDLAAEKLMLESITGGVEDATEAEKNTGEL